MDKMIKRILVAVLAALWAAAAIVVSPAFAAGDATTAPSPIANAISKGNFSALMFGDWYWVQGHHTDKYKGQNGMQFRRINFSYDYDIDEEFSARFRLEAANDDFTAAAAKMTPFVKDAFLKWKFQATHAALFGLSASPTWDEIEEFWGYRSVEKTPLDLQKWGGSRDTGLALRGNFDSEKRFGYHAMVGNGSDTSQETNKTKKVYLALDAKPVGDFYVQAYGDYETNKSVTPGSSVGTYQIFAGWKTGRGRVGAQYAHQWRGVTAGTDLHMNLVSVFGVAKLTDRWSALARWDYHMDYNPGLSGVQYFGFSGAGNTNVNKAKNTLLVFGADYSRAEGKVHFIPNVEIFTFGRNDAGFRPAAVVMPKLTVLFKF